jgi:type VI secretion system protein ImpI
MSPDYENLWGAEGDIAPPIDPKRLKAARDLQPVKPDFLDWAIDVPKPEQQQHVAPAKRTPVGPVSDADTSSARGLRDVAESNQVQYARTSAASSDPGDVWSRPGREASAGLASQSSMQPKIAAASGQQTSVTAGTPLNDTDFVRVFARNAGLPEDAFASRDPSELAAELGLFVRIATEGMRQLLDARQQAKRVTRSAAQTTVQALDNNPLKFAPTVEDALRVMFDPTMKSYLGAQGAFKQGFDDLKSHQVRTFSAMQKALKRLLDELDPSAVERALTNDRGLAGVIGSRKARLWDAYVTRWHARTKNQQDGQLNAFMALFAEYYDGDGNEI